MKAYVKRIQGSKAASLDLLVAAGIVTKKGNLTKPYRSSGK